MGPPDLKFHLTFTTVAEEFRAVLEEWIALLETIEGEARTQGLEGDLYNEKLLSSPEVVAIDAQMQKICKKEAEGLDLDELSRRIEALDAEAIIEGLLSRD